MLNPSFLPQLEQWPTPYYFYDLGLLQNTLNALIKAAPSGYHIHYALKANANPEILNLVREAGLGADCVSGNEVMRAIECGFDPGKIVFAGVGKSDAEIRQALDAGIFCFNVESLQELEVLNQLAGNVMKKAPVALRINPNVDAHTHRYITTGLEENKFGINQHEFEEVMACLKKYKNLMFSGLHFHIGSQIQDLNAYKNLCLKVNEINRWFTEAGFFPSHLNLGGGLGIDYREPDQNNVADFKSFFNVFNTFLDVNPRQALHFELGRCIVAQCGSLISRVLYVKKGIQTHFAILDAGMTELLRPALYQAYHKIENLSRANKPAEFKYDVVGPICESSDCFGKAVDLPETFRGDLIAIRSAGAYGEVMSSRYNLRTAPSAYYSD